MSACRLTTSVTTRTFSTARLVRRLKTLRSSPACFIDEQRLCMLTSCIVRLRKKLFKNRWKLWVNNDNNIIIINKNKLFYVSCFYVFCLGRNLLVEFVNVSFDIYYVLFVLVSLYIVSCSASSSTKWVAGHVEVGQVTLLISLRVILGRYPSYCSPTASLAAHVDRHVGLHSWGGGSCGTQAEGLPPPRHYRRGSV